MKHGIALALLALSGCASTSSWVQKHPRASAVIATSVVLSAALLIDQKHRYRPVISQEPRMSTPLVPDCSIYPELCK